jgi:hypothetical protein
MPTAYGSATAYPEIRRVQLAHDHGINNLVRVQPLPLSATMTTSHSLESTIARKIGWTALVLLAATTAACGGSTQNVAGTAPSLVAPIGASSDGVASLSLLKEGKGKGPGNGHSPAPDADDTPTVGTTPDPEDPDAGDDGIGGGHGHGKATIQLEGLTTSIDGSCPALTITMNNIAIKAAGQDTPVHLHIAAKKQEDALVAVYVRMQGPKGEEGDDAGDEEETTTSTN